jgi:hypothetical protein
VKHHPGVSKIMGFKCGGCHYLTKRLWWSYHPGIPRAWRPRRGFLFYWWPVGRFTLGFDRRGSGSPVHVWKGGPRGTVGES